MKLGVLPILCCSQVFNGDRSTGCVGCGVGKYLTTAGSITHVPSVRGWDFQLVLPGSGY
jgi:hypothetical protein